MTSAMLSRAASRPISTSYISGLPTSMRTLAKLYDAPGIWMDEKPVPVPRHNEVLVKIEKTAICGTDVSIHKWTDWARKTIPVGMTVGHEYAGTIVALGEGVQQKADEHDVHHSNMLTIGQRVSGEGHIVCGFCRNCRGGKPHLCRHTVGVGVNRQGAFAEYLALPAANVYPLPDRMSSEVGSILDPAGNAVHTALSFDLVGEDVLVTGAGPIGLLGAMVAKHVGAQRVVVTDVNDYRLELARSMAERGLITRAVNVKTEQLRDVTFGELGLSEGYDVGLEMSGNPAAFSEMISLMNNGGKVAVLGLLPDDASIEWTSQVIFKGLTLKGIYGREIFETWYKMSSMIIGGGLPVEEVITHRFAVEDYDEAFRVAVGGEAGRVVIDWTM